MPWSRAVAGSKKNAASPPLQKIALTIKKTSPVKSRRPAFFVIKECTWNGNVTKQRMAVWDTPSKAQNMLIRAAFARIVREGLDDDDLAPVTLKPYNADVGGVGGEWICHIHTVKHAQKFLGEFKAIEPTLDDNVDMSLLVDKKCTFVYIEGVEMPAFSNTNVNLPAVSNAKIFLIQPPDCGMWSLKKLMEAKEDELKVYYRTYINNIDGINYYVRVLEENETADGFIKSDTGGLLFEKLASNIGYDVEYGTADVSDLA